MAAAKKNTFENLSVAETPLKLDENQIIALYMEDFMENGEEPKNVYSFCKKIGISDTDFYQHFGSLQNLKQDIWVKFFENAILTLSQEQVYATYTTKNKLLTLYYTLFEILTLNRSYVLATLKENNEGLNNLNQLKKMRHFFKDFVNNIIQSDNPNNSKFKNATEPLYSEGSWVQFMFILKFWLEDNSKGFEKTDIIIEKSVNTVVDLLDTKPLDNIIDLGKFLWKERKM